jgi:hypothetical protein
MFFALFSTTAEPISILFFAKDAEFEAQTSDTEHLYEILLYSIRKLRKLKYLSDKKQYIHFVEYGVNMIKILIFFFKIKILNIQNCFGDIE